MTDTPGKEPAPERKPVSEEECEPSSIVPAKGDAIVPAEVIEALRRPTVDATRILVQVVQRVDPKEMLEVFEKIDERLERHEERDLDLFIRRANALIDVKTRDPDEQEKRKNNAVRRAIKYALVLVCLLLCGGAIVNIALRGAIALTIGLLCTFAPLALLQIPLASGESVSTNDMIQVLAALQRWAPRSKDKEPPIRPTASNGSSVQQGQSAPKKRKRP